MMGDMKFKDLIRNNRKARGWSLEQAAKPLCISKTYLWELESGKHGNPTVDVLNSLRVVYGISAKKLLDSFGIH
jgi:transcriptional regulator with XRE-family HTH domain